MLSNTALQLLYSFNFLLGIATASCPKDPSAFPKVTLKWGTVTPTECDSTRNLYIFRNVRFGKRTDGKEGGTPRFGAPQYPDDVKNPEDVPLPQPTGGTACVQVPMPGPDCKGTKGETPNWGSPILGPAPSTTTTEDCLFLDIFVPISAVESATASQLPVVVWFYGGAYLFGSKDYGAAKDLTLYDGRGLFEAAGALNKEIIYVAGNYRLAHLGWLAGSAVSQSKTAIANAGLADQRLLLQFVQDYIAKFGGDPNKVTAFGESAGGGSILHHLVAVDKKGDRRDPLFNQAITQSAAFQWIWEGTSSTGSSEQVFESFVVSITQCRDKSGADALQCLQDLDGSVIETAISKFWSGAKCSGVWNLGPVVDGKDIKQLPAIALESSDFSFHARLKGLIASHVADEAKAFIPKYVTDWAGFDKLLKSFLPGDSKPRNDQRACISERYKSFWNQKKRAKNVIQDSMFVCNVRFTYDAAVRQKLPVWLMDYGVFQDLDFALHATDLVPTFWHENASQDAFSTAICDAAGKSKFERAECKKLLKKHYWPVLTAIRLRYQKYFVGFIVGGDPNESGNEVKWLNPTEGSGGTLNQVMQVTGKKEEKDTQNFNLVQDSLTREATCKFWSCMASAVASGGSGQECGCGGSSGVNDEL
ncbi:Alpha/Beta hydrolase protein [Cladorrhinum sp. PSN259]|nr:Alpha/Beta hydrolase protein [Cladorrhinum sp. PSN259]